MNLQKAFIWGKPLIYFNKFTIYLQKSYPGSQPILLYRGIVISKNIQMKIEAIKTNLRNIVLLAKEYRENVPLSLDKEIKQLKTTLKHDDNDTNSYNREYLNTLKKERCKDRNRLFKQMIYFIEKTLLQFAKNKSDPRAIEIKQKKVDNVRKNLTEDEINLLSSIYNLYLSLITFKWYKEGEYKSKKVRELKSELIKIIDQAVKLEPKSLTTPPNLEEATSSKSTTENTLN